MDAPFYDLAIKDEIANENIVLKDASETGRPLRDYKNLIPISNRLETTMERVSKIGQLVEMKCSSPKIAMKSCIWTTPAQESFNSKNPNKGIKSILNDDHNCQIQIQSLEKNQIGNWKCKVELDGFDQYQEAILTATGNFFDHKISFVEILAIIGITFHFVIFSRIITFIQ